MKLFLVGAVFLLALGVFVWVGVVEGSIPVLKVDDVAAKGPEGQVIRVEEGLIGSIEKTGSRLIFTIKSGKKEGVQLVVESQQSTPPNFRVGLNVSVKGLYDRKTGKFTASEVTTACPSRYKAAGPEAAPVRPPSDKA